MQITLPDRMLFKSSSWPCSARVMHDSVLTLCVTHSLHVYHPATSLPGCQILMAPLDSVEIQQLAASILDDLSRGPYACSYLSRIVGGSASFTFRAEPLSPLVLAGKTTVTSVIVKKATSFAAINSDFALDSSRSVSDAWPTRNGIIRTRLTMTRHTKTRCSSPCKVYKFAPATALSS